MNSRKARQCGTVRTLLCLLQGLQSHVTTLELRNEITVSGTVESVDEKMKLERIFWKHRFCFLFSTD